MIEQEFLLNEMLYGISFLYVLLKESLRLKNFFVHTGLYLPELWEFLYHEYMLVSSIF